MKRLTPFAFGILIGWLLAQQKLSDLEFDKEMLLDFNEKLIREREQVTQEEEWPEVIGN